MNDKASSELITISNFSFSDLVDIPDLQQLVNQLSELAGCGIAILDLNDTFLASAGLQQICTCIHRVHPETRKHCFESDSFIEQNLKTKNPIAYKCKNGLWDVAYPIFIEEKHVANIFFGQFFFDDEVIDVPSFERQADKYGFDKTEYLSYVHQVPVISRKKADTLQNFITVLAQILTKTGYANLLLKKEKIEEIKLVNKQLKESELKFRKLFEQAGVGVAQVDVTTGKFVRINKKFADMLGYSINELRKLTFKHITYSGDLKESLHNQNLLLKKQIGEFSIEKRYVRKNGTMFWAMLTASSMEERAGGHNHQIAVIQDITERKKSEQIIKEENQRFQTTMNAIDAVVYVADLENHEILFVNKYVKDLFGDIAGKKCYSALQGKSMPCDFCTNHLLLDVNGNANHPYVWEFQNLITKRWYQCHDQAIQWTNGSLVRFEIATDITENKENEQALKENEIKLQELNATKDKFFSIISHDLRNPFSVLITGSELLSGYLEKNDLPKSKAKAAMIRKASNHGYALLENLLVWAKSQTGGIRFDPQKLSFKKSVSDSITEVEDHAIEKKIKIINEVPDDLILEADEDLLSAVFRNLITNAIKFTHSGGTVTITAKTDSNMVEAAVIDTGIGIAKEDQHKLFRIDASFSRAGTANEASTSLGLILCKEFIEKHNGKIWVESEVNKGSAFRFTLPNTQSENNSSAIS